MCCLLFSVGHSLEKRPHGKWGTVQKCEWELAKYFSSPHPFICPVKTLKATATLFPMHIRPGAKSCNAKHPLSYPWFRVSSYCSTCTHSPNAWGGPETPLKTCLAPARGVCISTNMPYALHVPPAHLMCNQCSVAPEQCTSPTRGDLTLYSTFPVQHCRLRTAFWREPAFPVMSAKPSPTTKMMYRDIRPSLWRD